MHTSWLRTGLLLVALSLVVSAGVVVPPEAEAGAPSLGPTHRDPVHKFSFKYFRDWKPVPIQPGEQHVVCKIRDPKNKGQMRGTIDPSIEVVRVRIEGNDEVTTGNPENMPTRPRFGPTVEDAFDATIGIDLARGTRPGQPAKEPELKKDDFDEIKSKDKPKLIGKLYEGVVEMAGWTGPIKLYVMLAVFEKDGVELGLYMSCGDALADDYARRFKDIARSFKYFDKRADDVESLDVLDGVNISPKRRVAIETSMVKGWDVIVSPKKNYIIVYNTKNSKNHGLAKEIAKRIEKIREQIYEVQFPPSQPITTVSIVRVCADRSEYHAYGGPGGSAGYWSSGTQELVFYDASPSKKIDDDTISVLYHEAFHQYIFYSVGDVAPHSWFNEGHGDYYAGAVYNRGKFKIKPFQWRVGVIQNAVANGPRERQEAMGPDGNTQYKWVGNGYTPLEHLVTFTQGDYYSYARVCYAQGWSLIYFLRERVPKNKKWNAKWGHILDTYFRTLKGEVAGDGQLVPGGVEDPEGDDADEDDDDGKGKKDGDEKQDPDGKTDGEDDDGPEIDPDTGGIARPRSRGLGGREALKKAVEKAFEGVDWAEFEKAWLEDPAG